MRGFHARALNRLGLAAVLLTAVAGVSVAVAPAAGATVPRIEQCQAPQGGTTYSSTGITVSDSQYCPPFLFKKDVSIWQFSSSNTWVEVASGTGSASYTCKGSTLRTHYETRTVDFGNKDFYDYCN
jgi:hypothetical protein